MPLELAAIAGALPWPDGEKVGDWWTRWFDPEVGLVGADRGPAAKQVGFVCSVKWFESGFDNHDLGELIRSAAEVPGFEPGEGGLAGVSLSGIGDNVDLDEIDVVWGPTDVISAWQPAG